jgi:hypothetical protein
LHVQTQQAGTTEHTRHHFQQQRHDLIKHRAGMIPSALAIKIRGSAQRPNTCDGFLTCFH